MRCRKPAHPPRVGPGSYRRPMSYPRYADAFGVDRGSAGCWRYVYADASGAGRPGRCPGPVRWAGALGRHLPDPGTELARLCVR